MIPDISPYRLDTAYRGTVPVPDDCFFSFRGEGMLLRDMGDGCRSLSSFRDLGHPAGEMGKGLTGPFSYSENHLQTVRKLRKNMAARFGIWHH